MGNQCWPDCEQGSTEALLPSMSEVIWCQSGTDGRVLQGSDSEHTDIFSFAAWYNSATAEDWNRLACIMRVASCIVGCELPTLDSMYRAELWRKSSLSCLTLVTQRMNCLRCCHRAEDLRALKSGSKCTHDGFYPTAVHTINDAFLHISRWHRLF